MAWRIKQPCTPTLGATVNGEVAIEPSRRSSMEGGQSMDIDKPVDAPKQPPEKEKAPAPKAEEAQPQPLPQPGIFFGLLFLPGKHHASACTTNMHAISLWNWSFKEDWLFVSLNLSTEYTSYSIYVLQ